jgi:hypothetical protein
MIYEYGEQRWNDTDRRKPEKWEKHLSQCHFGHVGGVVVSVLATGPRGCGFKTRPRRWVFKGDKNPQHTFLSDGK